MRRDDEELAAVDGDGAGRRDARLPLARQRNRPRVEDRAARQDGVAAHSLAVVVDRHEEHRPVARVGELAQLRDVLLHGFLQQQHHILYGGARDAAAFQIAHQARQIPATGVHIPREHGEQRRLLG